MLLAPGVQAATLTFGNVNDNSDGGYGVRGANGVLVTTASGYTGILGTFTISDSAVTSNFASGNVGAIASGFTAFDPVNGTFALDNFGGAGLFQTSESFDTRATSNGLGNASVYAVFYKGSSIATATELFVAKLNSTFPTDPAVGAPGFGSATLSASGVNSLLVGSAGAPNNYGFGAGVEPTYQLAAVAVPEPSRTLALGVGVLGLLMRRSRRGKTVES